MTQMYYVIYNFDGDTHVHEIDEKTLKERLKEKYYGNVEFRNKVDSTEDTNYWGESILIIKGSIVQPTPIQTVT